MSFVKQGAKIPAVTPNQPKTKIAGVRLAPELREPLERYGKERGLSLSDVVREAVAEFIERHGLNVEVTP